MRSLLAHLKLAHKLMICAAAFAVPLALLLYYAVSGFERQIRFTAREIVGARALAPLLKLALQPAGPQAGPLAAEVRRAEPQLGPLLARGAGAAAVFAAFPRLAENANLILDPDLDSYYLADLTLLRLPPLIESLRGDAAGPLDAAGLAAVRHAVSVALAENRRKHPDGSSLSGRLLPALADFEAAVPGPRRLAAAAALWQAGAEELTVLLERRAAALRRMELTALVLTLGAVAFAVVMLWLVVRNVSVPLARATGIADKIAAGRLESAARSLSRPDLQRLAGAVTADGRLRDEACRLLSAFGTMAHSLNSLLDKVRASCSEVEGAAAQMAAALREFETTVAEQAASTSEVAATSREIVATVEELARNMRQVTGMAAEAATLAGAGLNDLNGINAAMQDTLEGAAAVSAILNAISAKAANINCVLGAITNIANRTNLLSLNAAIEAEKAGEHAAGFTVVGLEIRRVADQTAVAALDIEKMLGDMQAAVGEGTRSMEAYAERSRGNSDTVAAITAELGRSIECTRRLEPHFEAVNSGMQAQAQAARQIQEAIQQLSTAAGHTRDALAQFRDIAGHMRATVGVLQSEMARFSVA